MHVDPCVGFSRYFEGQEKKSCFLSDIQDKIVNLHKPNETLEKYEVQDTNASLFDLLG